MNFTSYGKQMYAHTRCTKKRMQNASQCMHAYPSKQRTLAVGGCEEGAIPAGSVPPPLHPPNSSVPAPGEQPAVMPKCSSRKPRTSLCLRRLPTRNVESYKQKENNKVANKL